MSEKLDDYYIFLKEQIGGYKGKLEDYIYYLPDFFNILCHVLDEDDLSRQERNNVLAVLGYFVVPNDVIPEEIYGPAGYVDDLYLCCYILNSLMQKHGAALVERYWPEKNESAAEAIDYTFRVTEKALGEKVGEVLDYVGFDVKQFEM